MKPPEPPRTETLHEKCKYEMTRYTRGSDIAYTSPTCRTKERRGKN